MFDSKNNQYKGYFSGTTVQRVYIQYAQTSTTLILLYSCANNGEKIPSHIKLITKHYIKRVQNEHGGGHAVA
jgi:hypothetical protein